MMRRRKRPAFEQLRPNGGSDQPMPEGPSDPKATYAIL